jgi:hypothetical protein
MKENRFASERARENENRSIDRRRRVPPRDRSFSSGGASVRVQPSLFYVQDRRIEINQIESTRSNQTNHTQSNAIQRNPIRSNPPLDRADLRRREIRPIDRPSPRLRPTAARVRSREPSLDVARVATIAARRRARRRARASVRVKFSRAVSRARERDGASASASRASISRARRRAAPP